MSCDTWLHPHACQDCLSFQAAFIPKLEAAACHIRYCHLHTSLIYSDGCQPIAANCTLGVLSAMLLADMPQCWAHLSLGWLLNTVTFPGGIDLFQPVLVHLYNIREMIFLVSIVESCMHCSKTWWSAMEQTWQWQYSVIHDLLQLPFGCSSNAAAAWPSSCDLMQAWKQSLGMALHAAAVHVRMACHTFPIHLLCDLLIRRCSGNST